MDNRRFTRRAFLKKTFWMTRCCIIAALFSSASHCGPRTCRPAESPPSDMPLHTASLKEIVSRKRHHADGGFINPFDPHSPGRFSDLLKWRFFSRNEFRALYAKEKVRPVSIDWKSVKAHKGLSVTFINHAGVMIKDSDAYFLIDPVLSGLSFFIKDFTPLLPDPDMPDPHHVLITHDHYDHLDRASLKSLHRGAHFILPLGCGAGVDELASRRVTRLDWLDDIAWQGRQITLLPCSHWTMRNPLIGPNRSLWGSYLIRTAGGRTIYLSGDTAYFPGFRAIGAMADIDLAIMNVGAYEPRWFMKGSHMNPADTVKAFQELGAKRLMIVHWGTFRLGDEPVYLPPIEVKAEMATAGLSSRFVEIEHGQTLYF